MIVMVLKCLRDKRFAESDKERYTQLASKLCSTTLWVTTAFCIVHLSREGIFENSRQCLTGRKGSVSFLSSYYYNRNLRHDLYKRKEIWRIRLVSEFLSYLLSVSFSQYFIVQTDRKLLSDVFCPVCLK